MSQWINEQMQKAILWRIAIVKFALISLMTGGSCWLTATNQVDMTELSGWQWLQTLIGCFVAWSGAMLGWLDKSASQISEGRIPGTEKHNGPAPDSQAFIP